jgi:hypothetical protein
MQAEFVEEHRRHVTALTDLTVDDNVALAQFAGSLAQFVDWDIDRPR